MPIETILILGGIVAAFAIFAFAVAYGSIVAGGRFER